MRKVHKKDKTNYPIRIVGPTWEAPNVEGLSKRDIDLYRKRKAAIDMIIYADATVADAAKSLGVSHQMMTKLVNRCMEPDELGIMYGYFSLIPRRKLSTKVYPAKSITTIMEKNPQIYKEVTKMYFRRGTGANKVPSKAKAFRKFKNMLKQAGYTHADYPNYLEDGGMRSFYRWLDMIELTNTEFALARSDDDSRQRHMSTGGELKAKPRPKRPYEVIEIDAHDLDFFWCWETRDEKGNKIYKAAGRPVLYMAVDVATNAIVGYKTCYDYKPNHGTVLKLIESIIKPMEYESDVKKAVLPSAAFPEAAWAMPEVIKLDNATYQLADPIMDCIDKYGLILQYGPVSTPTYRARIERAFGALETTSGHMLPSTTGSNSKDIRRQDPEKESEIYGITRDVVENYVKLAVAQYNNAAKAGQNGLSPYQAMGAAFNDGIFPNYLPEEQRGPDFCIRKMIVRTIKGNNKTGKRPHIYWMQTEYTSPIIANDYNLIGIDVMCEIDTDDVSYMRIYTLDGSPMGVIHAKGPNEGVKISERTLKDLNKAKRAGYIRNNSDLTISDKFVENLKKNKNKSIKRLANAIEADADGVLPRAARDPDLEADEEFEDFDNYPEVIVPEIESTRIVADKERKIKEKNKVKELVAGDDATINLFKIAFGDDFFELDDEDDEA